MSVVMVLGLALVGGTACAPDASPDSDSPVPREAEPAGATESEPPDHDGPAGVTNFTRIDATVACAGATPPEAMPALRDLGFASIVNFRTAGERGASVDASRAAAEAVDLVYHHLPFREPSREVTEAFLDLVKDPANQPLYIHCGSANRVGAMWLIKRVRLDGWSVDDALAEARAIGLRSEDLTRFALEYVGAGAA